MSLICAWLEFYNVRHTPLPLVQSCLALLEVLDHPLYHVNQLCQKGRYRRHLRTLPRRKLFTECVSDLYFLEWLGSMFNKVCFYLLYLSHRHAFTAILSRCSIHSRHAFLSLPTYHTPGTKKTDYTLRRSKNKITSLSYWFPFDLPFLLK